MKKIPIPVIVCLVVLVSAGCSGGTVENSSQEAETPEVEATLPIPTFAPVATQTIDAYTLSAQSYISPSGAYEIFFPQGWNCSESGSYRVDCQSPDGAAVMNIHLIRTGERLTQPEFLNLVDAENNYTHAGKRAFDEIDRLVGDGTITVLSTWMEGKFNWMGEDDFERSESAIYHLSFASVQEEWITYEGLVKQVKEKASFNPAAITADPIYDSTFEYTSPDSLFTIEIPTSWTKFLDTASIQKSQIEQFFSPDRRASVQTVIYRHGALIEQEFKATKTLEILRALYGSGFRVSHDKALPDGRERLAWSVKNKDLSGISFFDSWGGSLYIFTVLWDDAYQELYQPVLDRVVDSFGYP